MHLRKIGKRGFKLLLAASLLVGAAAGGWAAPAEAAAADLEVTQKFGNRIGNLSYEAQNAFGNFYNSMEQGFYMQHDPDTSADWGAGDVFTDESGATYTLRVGENPLLSAMALSGHAKVKIGFAVLRKNYGFFSGSESSSITVTVNGQQLMHYDTSDTDKSTQIYNKSEETWLTPGAVIKIRIFGQDDDDGPTGVRGLYIKFEDKERPVLEGYTFTGNGATRENEEIHQTELYVKKNEFVDLAYNFSEPVRPTSVTASFSDYFLRHPLFVNPDGTGLPAAGQPQYLQNTTYSAANLGTYHDKIAYRYAASAYHNSGNLPLEPKVDGSTLNAAPMDLSLKEKLEQAVLADAAGNVATMRFPNKASAASLPKVQGHTLDPFDYKAGGYRVIVDAVRPKYSKSGNGIQPEILTGTTLNKGDVIDFSVQLTEPGIVNRIWEGQEAGTYLLFNNGMKAYYVSGYSKSVWKFRAVIGDSVDLETPLLKVIALSHDNKTPSLSDLSVIQDYAGNLLIQPANYDGVFENAPMDVEPSLVNSKIDWANLFIDNTKPLIGYRYEAGGATGTAYAKEGKVTIDANDPSLLVPALDPVVQDRGAERPSRGIYRPSNMTGEAAPSIGLVYYAWSQSPADPLAGKEADHYAAVKRYSLSAKQPSEELYPEMTGLKLSAANNKTNVISPPPEALLPENSGKWYLHTWTADMTWDTARELMQYEKMKDYVLKHAEQYEAWKAEAPGSEADKTFYADNKALAAVGQYGDSNEWKLEDFKNDDSNWTHEVGVLRLDNLQPQLKPAVVSADGTADVTVQALVEEPHSGIRSIGYQWVKDGFQPQELEWKPAATVAGAVYGDEAPSYTVTQSTYTDVFEDGAYWLYLKAEDQAGNLIVGTPQSAPVTVSSEQALPTRFLPEPNAAYTRSSEVRFWIGQAVPDYVGYAWSDSPLRPSDDGFAALAPEAAAEEGWTGYTIPDEEISGVRYAHVKAVIGDRTQYYSRAYYFDNEPPQIGFGLESLSYPLPKQSVLVTLAELYSKSGLTASYQWVREGDPEPSVSSGGWVPLGNSRVAELEGTKVLADGETADFRLYVKATDGAGNTALAATSGTFKLTGPVKDSPAAPGTSALVRLTGDEEDGYTAIVKLGLQTDNPSGYEYSVSPDGGESWQKWRPYTTFVSLKVPSGDASALQVQVKYRSPSGKIGAVYPVDAKGFDPDAEPVYAVAAMSGLTPVNGADGATFEIAPPPGIRIAISKLNPHQPTRSGNRFNVKQNGFYTFELTDLNDAKRKETLVVVVNNVDDVKPEGIIQYSVSNNIKTNGHVTAMLTGLEPIIVTNNGGKSIYTFTENGAFEFEFKDAAGNTGKATAVVSNIDRDPPRVQIVRSYAYGKDGSQSFGTLRDSGGRVVLSSGVTLSVVKADSQARDFVVHSQNNGVAVTNNGTVSFTIGDALGNTMILKEQVDGIVSEGPQPERVSYAFVDSQGAELPASRIVTIGGKKYAAGRMKVTLSGKVAAPNAVFSGLRPIGTPGAYSNQVSDASGAYAYSRIFESNGSSALSISDALGNATQIPVTVAGLDNAAPTIQLKQQTAGVVQNKAGFNAAADLGGYTVSDNLSAADKIKVEISGLDLSRLGRQRVAYTASDEVGNRTVAYQDVVVVKNGGLLIFGNGTLLSASSGEQALFDTNRITFRVSGYNAMKVGGKETVNEAGTFELLYQPGLYREGQMKSIASKLTYEQLAGGGFTVTFPKAGWYTIIVRTQERDREYASFFVGSVK
ncbi:hypothetical protein VE23_20185 [Paenibacillus sp. D9]|uniref:hypothetical protein n=1 Tax=Paenibacillus sp. D9 TaxID=665792 RepID=UPI00061E58FD|nr:hypothetical protein [Paenibacillus sp. D9]KKC48871.1 hypothetical protein VE23_20185 [Paenibacillus sp. D9]